MSGRTAVYEHYNAAKKALGRGNTVCQHAEELAKQTQENLIKVSTLVSQISFLRSAIYDQLQLLRTIATQINAEESRLKLEFTTTLKDLDVRDHELNSVLVTLRSTQLPWQLHEPQQQDLLASRRQTDQVTKTLFDFAHDEAVESLKGQLRQSIDDMQEIQEAMMRYKEDFSLELTELEKIWNESPSAPTLTRQDRAESGTKVVPAKQGAMSMSAVIRSYTRSQEEHVGEMAKLLLSLTEHYDHSSKLFQANSSMPMEELEELQTIVDHDAQQVDDVLLELDDRAIDMEEDVSHVNAHIAECTNVQMQLVMAFQKFESLQVDKFKDSLTMLESDRARIHTQLDILREQLTGLADHYMAFVQSYDALILEIDRRAEYENTIDRLRKQTEQTIARLAEDESVRREHFILSHGNFLPEDIWHGIRARPVAHEVSFGESVVQSPRLPDDLITAAKARLARY